MTVREMFDAIMPGWVERRRAQPEHATSAGTESRQAEDDAATPERSEG